MASILYVKILTLGEKKCWLISCYPYKTVQQMYRKKFEFENARLVGWLVNPKIKDYFV